MDGVYPWGRSLAVRFTTQTKVLVYSQIPQKKIDTQRFQVAAVMGTSVPGLPIIGCAGSCNSSVPRCTKVSTIDVMKKTIFERLHLVQRLGTLDLRVQCPYVPTPPPLTHQPFLDFRAIARKSRNSYNLRVDQPGARTRLLSWVFKNKERKKKKREKFLLAWTL